MRNVAGEIAGSMAAVRKAEELGLREITMLYDYRGIEEWATGGWKTNNPATQAYKDFMNPSQRKVHVIFEKVAAHTGIEGNEMADVMAKNSVGIPLTKSQQKLFDQAMNIGTREGIPGVSVESANTEEPEMGS
jgi:ribonuclease HI